jgi:hypothetical protein
MENKTFFDYMNNNISMKVAGLIWIITHFVVGYGLGFYDDLTRGWEIYSNVFNIGVPLVMIFAPAIIDYRKDKKRKK